MTLNPLLFIGLTIISLVLGVAALSETESWLVMIPSLAFVVLLFASLLQPVQRIATTRHHPAVKIPIEMRKLTSGRLEAYRDNRNSANPGFRIVSTGEQSVR